MRRLGSEVDGLDRRAAAHFAIGRTDLHVLEALRTAGPATPSQLAAAVGLSSGGLSIALERLERAGYIHRRPDPEDRRRVIVEATEVVGRLEAEVFGPLIGEMDTLMGRYSDAELATITDYLTRSAEAISRAAGGDGAQLIAD